MRKWFAVGLLILVLLAAGVAVVLINLNAYLNRNKAWLVERAQAVLARRVSFDTVGVSVRGGIGVRVEKLRVGDDPAFSADDFVEAQTVYVLIKVLPVLFGRYEVRRIAIDSPRIEVIRTHRGFNFASIGKRARSATAPPAAVRYVAQTRQDPSGVTAPPRLLIATLRLADAQIHYVDRTATPPFELAVRQLEATASDAGSATPMRVNARAAAVELPPPAGTARTQRDEARDVVLSATVQLTDGRPTATGTLTSAAGRVRGIAYQDLRAELGLNDRIASLRSLDLQAFNGRLNGRAECDLGAADAPRFDAHAKASDLALAPLLASQSATAPRLDGRLHAELAITGSGSGRAAVSSSLRGEGRVEIKDGVLKEVNVAEDALSAITGIGGLPRLIAPRVRDKYSELFATHDTRFDQLAGTARIAGGRVSIDDFTVAARDYTARGAGSLTFDKKLDLTVTLIASDRLTRDVLDDVKEARYLTGDSGRLEIPFRLTGTLPKVVARPDAEFVARALQRSLLGKGLEGLRKGRGGGETTPGAKGGAEELIRKGLQGLLGR